MIVFEQIDAIALPAGRPIHVAVGTFDGVHRGHRQLLRRMAERARDEGGLAVVFTFRNHPRAVVGDGQAPPLLTPWPMKRALLGELPLDAVVGIAFDHEFSRTEPEDFVRDVLIGRCRATAIASGADFRFGRGGRGNAGLLARMAGECGVVYEPFPLITDEGGRVSSTRARALLAEGNAEGAAELLGRPHRVLGRVVSGDALGRTIGFPTANLRVDGETLLPADGVYAVGVRLAGEDEARPGMMNLGVRPTVGGREHRAEVHLIDWEGELAGQDLTVDFLGRLRGEERFTGLEALRAQLARDRAAALALWRQKASAGA